MAPAARTAGVWSADRVWRVELSWGAVERITRPLAGSIAGAPARRRRPVPSPPRRPGRRRSRTSTVAGRRANSRRAILGAGAHGPRPTLGRRCCFGKHRLLARGRHPPDVAGGKIYRLIRTIEPEADRLGPHLVHHALVLEGQPDAAFKGHLPGRPGDREPIAAGFDTGSGDGDAAGRLQAARRRV